MFRKVAHGKIPLVCVYVDNLVVTPKNDKTFDAVYARDNWSVWTQARATGALRRVVALAGFQADEYALHSSRIEGATFLSAGGASVDVVQREGRRMSDACKGYARSRAMEAKAV